jgi:hypothetical protein
MRSLVRTQAETSYGELFGCIGHRTFGTLRPHCANLGTQCSFPDSRSQLAAPEGSPPVNDFGRLVGIEPNSGERLMTRKMLRPVALRTGSRSYCPSAQRYSIATRKNLRTAENYFSPIKQKRTRLRTLAAIIAIQGDVHSIAGALFTTTTQPAAKSSDLDGTEIRCPRHFRFPLYSDHIADFA